MSKKHLILSALGLLVTYGIAFGLDQLVDTLRLSVSQAYLSPSVLFFVWAFANLILAVCVFSLYTRALPGLTPWVVVGFGFLGVLVDFVPVLYWLPLGSPTLFLSQFMTRRGYLVSAGGWTAIAGLFNLLGRKRALKGLP